MIIDLGGFFQKLKEDRFFGEVSFLFQEGELVLVRKTETLKPSSFPEVKDDKFDGKVIQRDVVMIEAILRKA